MEGPARVAAAAARAGLSLQTLKLFAGVAVPEVSAADILVVMGGPMGVNDVGGSDFPFLTAEAQLLKARIAANAPTLGICLGAQLLAHAAGARVYPNKQIELGWGFVDSAYVHKALGPQGASIVLADTKTLTAEELNKGNQMLDNIFHCMLAN